MALPVHPLVAHRDRSAVEDLATKEGDAGSNEVCELGADLCYLGNKRLGDDVLSPCPST